MSRQNQLAALIVASILPSPKREGFTRIIEFSPGAEPPPDPTVTIGMKFPLEPREFDDLMEGWPSYDALDQESGR